MTQCDAEIYHPVLMDWEAIALKWYNRFLEKHPEIYRNYSPYLNSHSRPPPKSVINFIP